jgi:tRNA threonylcarbamoyladenosine biosynthesis protein TsaB
MQTDTTEPLILSIETATPVCSVALHSNGILTGILETFTDKSHSSNLVPMVNELLKDKGIGYSELNAVAVSMGPGSYTGLRIGVSTAKGICFARNIPLIGVSTLEALARQALNKCGDPEAFYCPMLDARRMEVYAMLVDSAGKITMPESAIIIDEKSFSETLEKKRIIFFGPGSDKCRDLLSGQPNGVFAGDYYTSASSVGEIAFERYNRQEFENTELFEPFYLKEFHTTIPKSRL